MASRLGMALGAQAPDFTLPDFHRQPWQLKVALARGPVVIVFFRGGWCPLCSAYLRRVKAELLAPAQALGATVVAISSDAPGVPSEHDDKDSLGFAVLSDPEGQMLSDYGAAKQLSPEEYALERQWHDLEAFSMNKKHLIAVPGVMVISRLAKVTFCELNPNLNLRPEPKRILEALTRS